MSLASGNRPTPCGDIAGAHPHNAKNKIAAVDLLPMAILLLRPTDNKDMTKTLAE